ncbi:hypothetical protein [Phenylobacterium montanum]|uniref:Antibiotic biosynthesis monooxygenase n=1 Tax=Phenylobacterium montanum TaxID=2823693 RepID=A0A975IUU9_9CAUL|nr:hypothetical protein [Caulobacter sp. S6]QUD88173.1 hypothetical protein KCG34_24625 [Caulobacter sp. S6]
MQRVTLVRYRTKPERTAENEALSRAVFKELRQRAPGHVAYALFRSGDEFVHLFVNAREPDSEVLTGLASFKAFSEGGPARWETQPEVIRMDVEMVEAYGLEAQPQPA